VGALLLSIVLTACGASHLNHSMAQQPIPATLYLQRASEGIQTLQRWYDPSTGLYQTTGWWNSANALTVLIEYARVANTHEYDSTFATTFTAAQAGKQGHPGFLNKYYDDEGWWALAWIDAYDLTGRSDYLSMAESIFEDMTSGWDNVCGGGIWWTKDRTYKNAIANELFLSLSASLANRDSNHKSAYIDWAGKEWTWFSRSGMINSHNLINDGLAITNGTTGTSCANNGGTTWTYNQGVVLNGLAELERAGGDSAVIQSAGHIAVAAISSLADSNGILHDACEPNCGADGVQFKGIFIRNLVRLYSVQSQLAYKTFVLTNADAIWDRSQGAGLQFGQVWSGPFSGSNAAIQSSALEAIVAAAVLDSTR
jgi:predicted alpha-1,6-mannanase (GH76 family)